MSRLKSIDTISSTDCAKVTVNNALTLALESLKAGPNNASVFSDIKMNLYVAGFSQKGRNRIIHLSVDEIDTLLMHAPKEKDLLPAYVHEIQLILRKMNHVRKRESFLNCPLFMGRPYVTIQLASAIGKLTALRHLIENGIEYIAAPKLRPFMMNRKVDGHFNDFYNGIRKIENDDEILGREPILLISCIQLLELYCDELISPPRLKCRSNFDEYDLHMIETGDFSWMDDDGEAYLDTIRDMPLLTYYDEFPELDAVLDWFLANKPVFDCNQIKRGWAYINNASEDWHNRAENYEIFEMFISEYPSWNCIAADLHAEWSKIIPPENPYKIVPLTTPKKLLAESKSMHHCVVTYIESCVSGETRIFSVLDANYNNRVATAELSNQYGQWNLVQLKGKRNEELIHRMRISSDPLAIALGILVKWYNENARMQR